MVTIEINHVSSDGVKIHKIIPDVVKVTLDYGFEIQRQNYPAIKIESRRGMPYYVVNAAHPESLVLSIQKTKGDILLDEDLFDPAMVSNRDAYKYMEHLNLKMFMKNLKLEQLIEKDAFMIFSVTQRKQLEMGIYSSIGIKNLPALASLWRATLPTPLKPLNVNKLQYFNALLNPFKSHIFRL